MIIFLTIAASLSPLLTFAHLFQLKEWRWDRLHEHIRSEGIRSIFGVSRPMLIGVVLVGLLVTGYWLLVPVILLLITALNILQIALRKQPYPVWTQKTISLVGTGLIFTGSTSYWLLVTGYWFPIVLLPLLQPAFLLAAWTTWKPIDLTLKHRILQKAQALRAQFPNITVIGITGSAGKTTTKELLAHILGPDRALATPEHVNTDLGVAQWLIKNLQPTTYNLQPVLIVEMGAYREGEITTLCDITKPTIGIITSIGTQHIGLFGSQKAIAEAKGELFAALPQNGHAFMNNDTPFAQELRKKCACPVTTVSTGTHADILATHIEETAEGLRFHVRNTPCTVPIHGEHQLGSVLLAIATATELGIALENIVQKLKNFRPLKHTFSLREEHGIQILDDTHNASPESFRAAIAWARHQPHKPKILVTTGIIEQGLSSARTHFQCGTLAKDVFDEACVLNKKFAQFFAEGFGRTVPYNLQPTTYNLPPGSLLVCVGRVPQNIIHKFLP